MKIITDLIKHRNDRKIIKERRIAIRNMIKAIRALSQTTQTTSNSVPGIKTDKYDVGEYTVQFDYMIRGDLIEVFLNNGHNKEKVCGYGDQTRQFGSFMGICDDVDWPDTDTAIGITKCINDYLNPEHAVSTPGLG